MKIRTKLTLRYLGVTAAVFTVFIIAVYAFSEQTREKEFFRGLAGEAITKANLFLSGRADAAIMQNIYINNREFIDEVEVAVYNKDFGLLYHDAQQIDIIKETQELINEVIRKKEIRFYEGKYQAVAMLYEYEGSEYIITAGAYDGYGKSTIARLSYLLVILWIAGMMILAILGYFMARSALSPVAEIVDEVDSITDSSLDRRLPVNNPNDELGELEKTFNSMLDRLEGSFENQKMFVSNISHELRTPLAALITELEIILFKERTGEQYREAILRSLSDAKKIEKLSSGLLDLARSNYDPKAIVMTDIRLDEIMIDARELVMKVNPEYEIDIIFDREVEDENMITIKGNEYLMKTAFMNLIENNCKFSIDHSSHINISFYNDKAVVKFTDTGRGMSREEKEKIFIPFYRGSNSAKTPGHGIGMALVQRIIDIHHGKISVHSEEGEGTSFVCEIPHL